MAVSGKAVTHPSEWEFCGYQEIQSPKKRKGIIDFKRLMSLLDIESYDQLKEAHSGWVDSVISNEKHARESKWT